MIDFYLSLAKRFVNAASTSLLLTASITSHAIIVDFEVDDNANPLSAGDILTGATISGATFSVYNQGNVGSGASPGNGIPSAGSNLPAGFLSGLNTGNRELMLFNADCGGSGQPACTGNDPDLAINGAGNILIISEDNDSNDPDDSLHGGTILVDFAPPVVALSSLVVDVGDNSNQTFGDSFVNAYYQGNFVEQFIFQIGQGNNNLQTVTFNPANTVDLLVINIASSGGIVNLEYTPIPVPGALLLFASAILGLAWQKQKTS